jgi:transposase-like protein
MTPEKVAYALQLLAEPDRSMASIAKMLGISRSTLYKALPELLPPQLAQQRVAAQIEALPADTRPAPALDRYDQLLSRQSSAPT